MGYMKLDGSEDDLHLDSWTHNRDPQHAERLARHIAEHVREAYEANSKLRDPELRAAANRASEVTEGRLYFGYSTAPEEKTTYYVFNPDQLKRSTTEALQWLLRVAASPDELVL